MSDFGRPGFGGAAPPPGLPHHYRFRVVFALDTDKLDVSDHDDGAASEASLRDHTLDQGRSARHTASNRPGTCVSVA
jgi:phosphatidylethanolamine-binding protein (PEBP) family uncharacterized protein